MFLHPGLFLQAWSLHAGASVPSEIPRYEEQLEKFVDTVDPLIEHAPAKLLEFAKAGKNELLSEQN